MVMHWVAHWWFWLTGSRDEAGTAYGLWSGFGGALPDVMIAAALAGWVHANNCHQHRCWRIGRHPVGASGVRTCRKHHPALSAHGKLTAGKIAEIHEAGP